MSSAFWKSVFVSPIVFGITLLLSTGAIAAPKSTEIGRSSVTGTASDLILNKASGANQVKVAQTTPAAEEAEVASETVKPGDWSYKALQDVATKYGCNANLNNQPVSQLEFARGLNACLNKIEPILAQNPGTVPPAPADPTTTTTTPAVTQADLEVIKRLTQEYRAQLTEIDGRLTSADKKVAQAQANQFSTTTKLKGEAVFNVSSTFSGATQNNIVFGDRVRLLFESSFTGQDKLFTRLATGNVASLGATFNSPSNVGAQVVETNGTNSVGLDWLAYQFPVSSASVYVAAFNGLQADYAPTYAPNFDDFTGASGSLSAFAESSPIYKIGGGTGVGATIPVAETGLASVNLGYFAFGANNPATGQGLFGIDNSLFGQLNFKFSPQFDAGLTYINSSHSGTIFNGTGVVVGTPLANNTGVGRTTANSFGAQFAYKASDKLAFNAFAMTSNARRSTGVTDNIWSYGGGISFPDVDGKGGLLGLFVGAEPYVSGVGSVPFHVQGFYKYKLSDNLSITPGLIFVTNPDQTSGNSALVGVVRTTFLF
jgi:Carbohydrate-selective porin, OprB family